MVDPAEFLLVAERYQNSTKESERRTSVGRSYYALYNQVVAGLRSKGVNFPRKSTHECLIYYLTHCNPGLAEDLKTLRNNRVLADYNMETQFSAKMACFFYQKAFCAVESFRQLTDPDLDRIAQCILYLPKFRP